MIEGHNRAFLYGESVFTTLRMINGFPRDWDYHFDRLKKGVEFVYGPFTDEENWVGSFKDRLETRLHQEAGDKVIRITVYRNGARGELRAGPMSSSDLKLNFMINPFDSSRIEGRSLSLRTCAASIRPLWWPAFLKVGNYFETILAQKAMLKEGDDDLLFLSPEDTVLESSVANIFIVRHNKLYTPPAGPNVLEGVMRRKILDVGEQFFDAVLESTTTMEQLLRADGLFGCNSVRGLFLVSRVDGHEFEHEQEFISRFEKLKECILR
jgi:branched-subunit amino acid aminotransferase/4-amino-4-deoxychorismate lyase